MLSPRLRAIKSVRSSAAQQVSVAVLSHPFSAGQVRFPCALSTLWLKDRIDAKNGTATSRQSAPAASSNSSRYVAVIPAQYRLVWRDVCDGRFKRRRLHVPVLRPHLWAFDDGPASVWTATPFRLRSAIRAAS